MPLSIDNMKYYRTSEACALAGISRETFLRWVREGAFPDVKHRDFRGWRLFTDDDLARLKTKVGLVTIREKATHMYIHEMDNPVTRETMDMGEKRHDNEDY